MSDLISREDAIKKIVGLNMQVYEGNACVGTRTYLTKEEIIYAIDELPSAEFDKDINIGDKETVLIEPFDANLTHVGYCMCGELVNINYSYCPRCGRKIEWRRMI